MNFRKITCLVLALCLSLSLWPMTVRAEETVPQTAPTTESSPTGEPVPVPTVPEETTEATEATAPEETTEPTVPEDTTEATVPEEDDAHLSQSSSMGFGAEAASMLFLDVPKYYQDDYPDTPYGDGTVATSGCTITCLAMAASYLQGRRYSVPQLAAQFQDAGSDNIQRMEAAADALGLAYRKAFDWDDVLDALDDEKLVILLLDGSSPFTDADHTILLTGYGSTGILVNDPNRRNYDNPQLEYGFENGFLDSTVSEGFAGGWIFEDTDTARQARDAKALQNGSETHKPLSLSSVPLYLQTDYPYIRYGDGSIATSGCALTCAAMVASYLRQEEILPDELVRRFGTYESSHIQRMEAASTVLDLTYEPVLSWWEVREGLRAGKVAIVLLESDSEFTNIQHTVVVTGLTADGKVLVNDPNGRAYDDPDLKDGFAHGFPEDMLQVGFSGGWIYDAYTPPEPRESRYPDFALSQEDLHLIASTIYLEARGESFEGQQAIAEIIFNRLASGNFSKTVQGTILAEGQFRTAKFLDTAQPGELQYKAIEKALSGPNVLPEDVYFFGRTPANKNIWGYIGRHVFCRAY
ncbi:MAG: C39 family peptidase [Eubacteriales bacterium]|nr:C39 family peptidase [Eubacteriales bacterium]